MLSIARDLFDSLGFDFDRAVADHQSALLAHAATEGLPAPSAHPLVAAAVVAGGYTLLEPAPEPPAPPGPAPTVQALKRLVDQERDRRLALGFAFDFGDHRGLHRFATSFADRRGWAEVESIAAAAMQSGQPSLEIAVRTESGDVVLQAQEWSAVMLAAADTFQPVWQAAWSVKDEIEADLLTDPAAISSHAAWPPEG